MTASAVEYLTETDEQEARQLNNLRRHAARLLPYLSDPLTLDVCVNPDESLWVNSLGRGYERVGDFPRSAAKLLLAGIATMRRIPFDHQHPILETILPLSGDRIEGIISPVVDGVVIAIRTRQKKIFSLEEMADSGILTDKSDPLNSKRHHDDFLEPSKGKNHIEILQLASVYRRNILLVGPTGAGKTTMANSIVADWCAATPQDRVVLIEDTPELQCSLRNHVQLLATGDIDQAKLLVTSLRLNPKRLVVGEVREEAPARVLLGAWNTGHRGGLSTIHANDALSGLTKLEQMIGDGSEFIRERIAGAIDVVAFIDNEQDVASGRKVREMLVLKGYSRQLGKYEVEYV